MKISIVLPVYNVYKYLKDNLDSLVSQTYKNIEIIYVDDESPDDSAKLIKEYQKKYSNIKLYSKKNGGVSSARNYGLKKATGDYILFIDSDDTLKPDACEHLIEVATNKQPDIVTFNYDIVYPNKQIPAKIIAGESRFLTPYEYIMTTPCVWNKLFKRSLLTNNKWHLPEGMIYEDLAAVPIIAKYNPQVYYLNESLYNYIQSEESLMRSKEYKKKYEDIFPAIDILYNNLNNTLYNEQLEYIVTNHLLCLNFYHYRKYHELKKGADTMKKYYPKWAKNRIVKEKFTKKQITYMKLFYHKLYFLIDIYQHLTRKGNWYHDQSKHNSTCI